MSEEAAIRCLLVEDDEVDAEMVQLAFTEAGVELPLELAIDGLEAIERLRESPEQAWVVLLDLNTPRMNGIEFLETLRNDPRLGRTTVFVLTTSKDPRDVRAAYDFGAMGYAVKSHDPGSLVELARLLDAYTRIVRLP